MAVVDVLLFLPATGNLILDGGGSAELHGSVAVERRCKARSVVDE